MAGLLDRVRKWIWGDDPMHYRARLAEFRLGPGDVAIDCGANVGNVTEHLAAGGATVYAFEPNPYAFAQLAERFASRAHIHCLPQAVLDRPGQSRLYLHTRAAENQVGWSQGSSLLATKSNVNPETFAEVTTIDLAEFILGLGRSVRVVKMDIEGVECRVIQRLLDSGAIAQIGHLLVETHDSRIPELRAETDALRERIAREGRTNIRLDWV
jgi:FkbM family methyltransferase